HTELDMKVNKYDRILKAFFNLHPPTLVPRDRINISRLPRLLTSHCFGRDDELILLDKASPVKVTLPLSVCYTPGLRHTLAGGGHHAGQSVRTFCGEKSSFRHGAWHAGTRLGRRPTRCLVCPHRPEAVHPHCVVFDGL